MIQYIGIYKYLPIFRNKEDLMNNRCSTCTHHQLDSREVILDCEGRPAWITNPEFDCLEHLHYYQGTRIMLGPKSTYDDSWISTTEAAELIGISSKQLLNRIDNKKISASKDPNGRFHILKKDAEAYKVKTGF